MDTDEVTELIYRYTSLADGQRMGYIDQGDGAPALLLHGYAGTARTHMGSLIQALAEEYRVIAPDLRGYGRSQPGPRRFPSDFYRQDAEDMAELMVQLDLPPAIVLGFSDGAESALLLAAIHPRQVRAVVAWGVCGIISAAQVQAVQSWLPTADWGDEREEWRHEICAEHGEAQFQTLIEGWVQAAETIFAAGGNICLQEARAIRSPTLLINGSGEIGNPPEDVQRLADAIPNAQLQFVPDCVHAAHSDQPQIFMALVSEFLTQLAPDNR